MSVKTLAKIPYHDSLLGAKLHVSTDGRERGLWVSVEYDSEPFHDINRHRFDEGLEMFIEDLKKIKKKDGAFKLRLAWALRRCFPSFFDVDPTHGVMLEWDQVPKLAKALKPKKTKSPKRKSKPSK